MEFNFTWNKYDFSKSISEASENVNLFASLLYDYFHLEFAFIYAEFLWCRPPNNKCLLELIKRRSKVQEKNIIWICFNPLNRGGIADLPLLRTLLVICQRSQEPGFYEVIGSFGCFTSISKFGSIKNSFEMITSLSELYIRFRRFILLVQTKKIDFYELWQ